MRIPRPGDVFAIAAIILAVASLVFFLVSEAGGKAEEEIRPELNEFCEEQMDGQLLYDELHYSKCRIEMQEKIYEEFQIKKTEKGEYYLLK